MTRQEKETLVLAALRVHAAIKMEGAADHMILKLRESASEEDLRALIERALPALTDDAVDTLVEVAAYERALVDEYLADVARGAA